MRSIGFGAYDNFASTKMLAAVPHYSYLQKFNPDINLGAFETLTTWDKIKSGGAATAIIGVSLFFYSFLTSIERSTTWGGPSAGEQALINSSKSIIFPYLVVSAGPYIAEVAWGKQIPLKFWISSIAMVYFAYKLLPAFILAHSEGAFA